MWGSIIMGGVGALASGISAISNFQKAKQADKSAKMFADQLMGMKEDNAFKALQVPDLASLQFDRTAQQAATATNALQGMGPEGAAQIANLNKSVLDNNAQIANDQAALVNQRNTQQAVAQQDINASTIARQAEVTGSRLVGAQNEAAQRRANAYAGIEGMITGGGDIASGIVDVKGGGLGY